MNKGFSTIVVIALLLSCSGNKKQELASELKTGWDETHQVELSDTLTHEGMGSGQSAEEPVRPLVPSPSSGTSSSYRQHQEYGNMRGFDPASEDDMDDNGMSRYMENNDDEGWD